MKPLFCAILFSVLAWCQAPQPSGGVESEWDLRKLLDSLAGGTARVKPIVDQSDPRKWSDAEAGRAYDTQWKTALNELGYLATSAAALSKQPERLTLAFEAYFRLQAVEITLSSFMDGMRRYGNPAVADLLQAAIRENGVNRDRLRQYVIELSQNKEQEYQVMDKEAQRCRAILNKPPATRPRPKS